MPSFWEYILDVLHVPGVATRISTRSIAITCAPTSLVAPHRRRGAPPLKPPSLHPSEQRARQDNPYCPPKKRGIPKREPRLANAPVTCITFPAVRVQKLGI